MHADGSDNLYILLKVRRSRQQRALYLRCTL